MKLDPTTVILDMDDKPVTEDVMEATMKDGKPVLDQFARPVMEKTGERVVTLALIAERALSIQKQESGDQQYLRYKLAMRLHRARKAIKITTEEATLIKTCVAAAGFNAIIYGRVEDIVEGRDAPSEPTEAEDAADDVAKAA